MSGSLAGLPSPNEGVETTASAGMACEAMLAIAWVVLARSAEHEEARLVAYMFAFLNALAAVSWLVTLPMYGRHLAGLVREPASSVDAS